MANETVLFKRGDSATITSTPVTDGQILFDTSGNGKMYLDNGTDRLEMGGAITVDASLSKTSTNAIQNKAVTGNILNSLAEVSAATQQNTIAGALALKEVSASLGDISNVGNDTYNSVEKLLQYYIDNGYLPDVNNFPLLPTMTSNTSGNIVLSAISYNSDTLIYYACDGNTNTRWTANVTSTPVWWKVDFGNSYIVKRVEITFNSYATSTTFKIQGSNDNSTWTDLSSEITVGAEKEIITLNNNSSYRYYRVYISAQTTSGATKKGHIQEIQFYRIK